MAPILYHPAQVQVKSKQSDNKTDVAPHFKDDSNIYHELMHLSELLPAIYSLLLSKLSKKICKKEEKSFYSS